MVLADRDAPKHSNPDQLSVRILPDPMSVLELALADDLDKLKEKRKMKKGKRRHWGQSYVVNTANFNH